MIEFRQKMYVVQFIPAALKAIKGMSTANKVMVGSNALMGGGMIGSAVIGNSGQKKANEAQMAMQDQAMRQQEKMQKEQMRQQEKMQKEANENALKIAKIENGKTRLFSSQKEFANAAMFKGIGNLAEKIANSGTWKKVASTNTYKNASGFARDVFAAGKNAGVGQKAANMAGMGAVIAGGGYVVDKAIQHDAKKNNIPIDAPTNQQKPEKTKGQKIKRGVAATAGTAATVAGTLVLARKGKLNAQTFKNVGNSLGKGIKSQFVTEAKSAEEIAKAKKTAMESMQKKAAERGWSVEKIAKKTAGIEQDMAKMGTRHVNTSGILMNGAFAALPAVGYVAQKSQTKDQITGTQEQKEYAAVPAKAVGSIFKTIGTRVKSGANGIAEFLSFGAGRSGQRAAGEALKTSNLNKIPGYKSSGSTWTKKASEFLSSHETDSLGKKAVKIGGGVAVGSSVMFLPWQAGEKATKKAIGTVDKKAYAYEKSQDQQIQ